MSVAATGGAEAPRPTSTHPPSKGTAPVSLVKPGARKVLHVGGRVARAVPSGQGQHPGVEIEFSSMSGDDSARLGQWLE